ncbi:hypothetical protein SDC9_158221 [bioreactor metagenome]|uniref:Uncharacterized protein n=1 Tax=bioreactor metagenome TaxID=1076179 RepID=A0A645FEK5_9ZZZZ
MIPRRPGQNADPFLFQIIQRKRLPVIIITGNILLQSKDACPQLIIRIGKIDLSFSFFGNHQGTVDHIDLIRGASGDQSAEFHILQDKLFA